jgi:hypothetical protein
MACTAALSGTPTTGCGTWPNCGAGPCCGSSYTGCSGSSEEDCGTYPDCGSPPCCDGGAQTGCAGTNPDYPNCASITTQDTCMSQGGCCTWTFIGGGPAGTCGPTPCEVLFDPCLDCGCTPVGTCAAATPCGSLSPADCASCAGCAGGGSCPRTACGALSGANRAPDVCPGCSTCPAIWQISDARGNTPWSITVTGLLDVQAGGSINVAGGYVLDVNDVSDAALVTVTLGTFRIG